MSAFSTPRFSRVLPIALVTAVLAAAAALLSACDNTAPPAPLAQGGPVDGWSKWGNDDGGMRFSRNTQITPQNVKNLKVAWTYRTGDLAAPGESRNLAFEATPILVRDTLYLCSPRARISAIDAATGKQKWMYDAKPDTTGATVITCRGVSYWADGQAQNPDAPCAQRIFAATIDGRLIALDALTGRKCDDFADHGEYDLHTNLGPVEKRSLYGVSSAPTIAGDLVITGSKIIDFHNIDMPGGVVRAFDARTGRVVWAFTAAPPGTPDMIDGHYPRSTPNTWGPMSLDMQRKLIFLPTGTAQVDSYKQNNNYDYYGSSVVALNVETGQVVWHYQFVHKDTWDYDTPSQPMLFDYKSPDGTVIPALAQATKMGYIFVLNRETGVPIFPVRETPVPQGGVQPDLVAKTQPIPLLPEHPMTKTSLTEDDMWGFTPLDRHSCVTQFRKLENRGMFTPYGAKPTLNYPISLGGMDWGGVSFDPTRNLLLVNSNNVMGDNAMVPHKGSNGYSPLIGTPFRLQGSGAGYSMFGAPCVKPPWGKLTAIDMTTGRKAWEVPLGTTRDEAPWPLWFNIGVPNQGGTIATASGLTFIAATTDRYFRAFDSTTGKELWRVSLPAAGQSMPMTYRLGPNGKQYVVLSAGGHSALHNKQGDYVIAYALP